MSENRLARVIQTHNPEDFFNGIDELASESELSIPVDAHIGGININESLEGGYYLILVKARKEEAND